MIDLRGLPSSDAAGTCAVAHAQFTAAPESGTHGYIPMQPQPDHVHSLQRARRAWGLLGAGCQAASDAQRLLSGNVVPVPDRSDTLARWYVLSRIHHGREPRLGYLSSLYVRRSYSAARIVSWLVSPPPGSHVPFLAPGLTPLTLGGGGRYRLPSPIISILTCPLTVVKWLTCFHVKKQGVPIGAGTPARGGR